MLRTHPLVVLGLLGVGLLSGRSRAAPGPTPPSGTCTAAHVRWASGSNRLYVSGAEARCTLTDLRRVASVDVPLELVDAPNRVWKLGANLVLEEGATLVLDGTNTGDVAELRLRSNNTAAADAFVELRAMWGTLLIRNTRLTSWDEDKGGPDTEHETYGRAFVRVLSYLDGTVPRESRMDVVDSDIGYLGYYASESYGLVWKVRGEDAGIFDQVDVLGDVTGSTIHDNYFGMYSFGAFGMNIVANEFYDNVGYGVDPHDDSDGLVVEENYIHDNGNHGFICSMRCDGLSIRNNVSSSNAGVGFMLHRAVTDSVVEGNLAEHNGTGGFAIVDSYDNVVRGNVARGNQYGIRFSTGATDNLIEDNDFSGNVEHGIFSYLGADVPTVNDGRMARNRFVGNVASGNGTYGLRADDAYMNEFIGNVFADSGEHAVFLSNADENVFQANDLGGSYMFAQRESANQVVDTDAADVAFGDATSSFTFTDASGRVFHNPEGRATVVGVEGSSLTLTGGTDGVLAVDALPLAVTPVEGTLSVVVLEWEEATRAWSTTKADPGRVKFTLGELSPGVRYTVTVDGERVRTVFADATGSAWFRAELGAAPHTFSVTPARWNKMRPPPVKFGR